MISVIKNSSYGGTIAILVASFLWGTTGTAAAFAPTLGPLAIGAVAMGEVGFTGIDCISGHPGTPTIYWAKYFYYSFRCCGSWDISTSFLFFHALCRNYDWYGGFNWFGSTHCSSFRAIL